MVVSTAKVDLKFEGTKKLEKVQKEAHKQCWNASRTGLQKTPGMKRKTTGDMEKRLAASQVQGHVKIRACERSESIVAHKLRELAQENEAGPAMVEGARRP